MSETPNQRGPNLNPETAQFVQELMGFAMSSAAEARFRGERTPELIQREKDARKMDLLRRLGGDAEKAQLLLSIFERCEQLAWEIDEDPWMVRKLKEHRAPMDPLNVLAKVVYGDNYKQGGLSTSQQEALGRLEATVGAFTEGLSFHDVREDGIDGYNLFHGVASALYPDYSEDDRRELYYLADGYFTAGGGIDRATRDQLQ
ncbi:MAG TPA: hypothetical protein VFT53_00580 [Candidatus Saccharimonadales bacterium]|nr:hypothetical protein [Candidatus Saccharimonadales bacterium]